MALIGINARVSNADKREAWEKILDAALSAAQITGAGVDIVQTIKNGKMNRKLAEGKDFRETNADLRDQNNTEFTQNLATETLNLNKQKEQNEQDYKNKYLKILGRKIETSTPQGGKPSVGETAVDKNFAKTYEDYVANGGFANVQKNLNQLNDVLKDFESGKINISGPGIGLIPKEARDVLNPKGSNVQDLIEQSVMGTMKQTLGAQFTEKEGRRVLEKAFNGRLPEAENKKRLERVIGELETQARAKQRAVEYFETKGTLNGFKGELPSLTADDFLKKAGIEKLSDSVDGKLKVSNGVETLFIDPKDLLEAEKDGYKRL